MPPPPASFCFLFLCLVASFSLSRETPSPIRPLYSTQGSEPPPVGTQHCPEATMPGSRSKSLRAGREHVFCWTSTVFRALVDHVSLDSVLSLAFAFFLLPFSFTTGPARNRFSRSPLVKIVLYAVLHLAPECILGECVSALQLGCTFFSKPGAS